MTKWDVKNGGIKNMAQIMKKTIVKKEDGKILFKSE